jgi:hypothetical protein
MNAPTPARPALFASVRASKDRALAGFAVALLVAFALHAGAFLPSFGPAEPTAAKGRSPVAAEASPKAPAPAAMARHRALRAARAPSEPCRAPRG